MSKNQRTNNRINPLSSFVKSFITGILISIGGIVNMSCDNKYIGAFLFGTGLFTVLTFGFGLFTGKVGYVVENHPSYLTYLLIVWIGNLSGTFISGYAISLTRIGEKLREKAIDITAIKQNDSLLSLFVLAIFCGMLMFIAADGYKNIANPVGQMLVVFLPVMAFIISGFEHSIADMFYISAAQKWDVDTFLRILVISAGNAVGGISIPLLRKMIKKT